jgi:hypothetical protein
VGLKRWARVGGVRRARRREQAGQAQEGGAEAKQSARARSVGARPARFSGWREKFTPSLHRSCSRRSSRFDRN